MKSNLKSEADVKNIINILLNQVLDKENYELRVHGEIHFEECEPEELGYVIGSFTFQPWGADAFQCMQTMLENVVQDDYISIELDIENMQEPVEPCKPVYSSITEDNVREHFNRTFSLLDDSRSAGAFYVGDNGAYMCDYMDITPDEVAVITEAWKQAFTGDSFITNEYRGNCLMIHIS
jgi:hypothetical protein